MKNIIIVFVSLLPFFALAQEPSIRDNFETVVELQPVHKNDSDLVYTDKDKKVALYFNKALAVQTIDMICITIRNKETIHDLEIVRSYLMKKKSLKLNSADREKLAKPYNEIRKDTLALTYHYFPEVVSDMLYLGACKIVREGKAQKKIKVQAKDQRTKPYVQFAFLDDKIFLTNDCFIKASE